MKTSIDKLPNIITEFVDNKLIPSSPGSMKWVLGGITYLVLNKEQEILNKYLPTLTMLGLVEGNLIDTVQVRGFISSAFAKSPKLEIFNYTLDKSDGDFLVALLEKYANDSRTSTS